MPAANPCRGSAAINSQSKNVLKKRLIASVYHSVLHFFYEPEASMDLVTMGRSSVLSLAQGGKEMGLKNRLFISGWKRRGNVKALDLIALERLQDVDLGQVFNAFSDNAHAQRMRHRHNRREKYLALVRYLQPGSECLVHLQDVEVQPVQLGQGGITGPKVIHQDFDAMRLQGV